MKRKQMIINIENSEYYLGEFNCDSWVLMNSEKFYFHEKAQQFLSILKGKAPFFLTENTIEVDAQNEIPIPPLQKHFITNQTLENLAFLVISNPSTNNNSSIFV